MADVNPGDDLVAAPPDGPGGAGDRDAGRPAADGDADRPAAARDAARTAAAPDTGARAGRAESAGPADGPRDHTPGAGHDAPEGLVGEAVRRPLAARWAAYTEEVQRLVDATYRVVERTGSLDPTVREILRESGLSNQAFYRHFRSKDELLVALLDDGRRRMAGYLRRRMAGAADTQGKVRAWVEGVLAQAADPVVAARTRPFLAHQDRLAELFADEQRASIDAMLRPLEEVLERTASSRGHVREDAVVVYRLTLACLHDHLRRRTAPTPEETAHVVRFVTAGLGLA